MLSSTTPISPGTAPAGSRDPSKIRDTACQFEALLIQQMLRSAHSDTSDDMLSGESGSALAEMAEQQFAQLLANHGGIGFAKMVVAGLGTK